MKNYFKELLKQKLYESLFDDSADPINPISQRPITDNPIKPPGPPGPPASIPLLARPMHTWNPDNMKNFMLYWRRLSSFVDVPWDPKSPYIPTREQSRRIQVPRRRLNQGAYWQWNGEHLVPNRDYM